MNRKKLIPFKSKAGDKKAKVPKFFEIEAKKLHSFDDLKKIILFMNLTFVLTDDTAAQFEEVKYLLKEKK